MLPLIYIRLLMSDLRERGQSQEESYSMSDIGRKGLPNLRGRNEIISKPYSFT